MKLEENKKYTTIALYSIGVFATCLIMVIAVFKFKDIISVLNNIRKVLNPIIWGLVLAYLLNPIMSFFEKMFKHLFEKKKPHPRLCRYISITITTILTLLFLSGLIAIVIPQIRDSLLSIFNEDKLQMYYTNSEKWFNKLLENNPDIMKFVNEELETIQGYLTNFIDRIQPSFTKYFSNITASVINLAIGIKDFFLGFIIMVYLLSSKEIFKAQIKKIMYAFLPKKTCVNMLSIWHKADTTFMGFISGKTFDSFIIGMLCFIAIRLMHINLAFAVLISFIVGITNIIPFFGPFIGAIPSILLILLEYPNKIVAFTVFIIILHQFNGNILEPKILGDSTGLPAFWVIFAIFIGGGLFGFIGMLLCIPVFAVIYMLMRQLVEAKLKKKNFPYSTKAYKDGKRIIEIQEFDDSKISE